MYCAVTASWCASPELTAYFGVMPNGHTTQLTFPRQEVFDVGDVLLVGTDFYRKVPHDVWPLKPVWASCAVRSTKRGPGDFRRPRSRWRTLRHRLRASRASSRIKTPPGIIIGSLREGSQRGLLLGGGVELAALGGVLFAHRIHAGEDFFGAEHVGGHHAVIDIGLGRSQCSESMPAAASFTICC